MDEIINKFIKKIPLGIVIGCYMIEYKIVDSIFYPGFADNTIQIIKSVFRKFHYIRITEGTIITSKKHIPINNNHTIEDISKFLNYPCSIVNHESNEITFVVKYERTRDILLTLYCTDMTDDLSNFINNVGAFIDKMNGKLKKHLDLHIKTEKYYTLKNLRQLHQEGKLDKLHKQFIKSLPIRYNYKTLYNKVKDKEINMFLKKNKKNLAIFLRLCQVEQMGFFDPSDKKIKEEFYKKFQ